MREKKARVMANQAGVEAMLRKGREMDEMHNRRPVPEVKKEAEKRIEPVQEVKKEEPAKEKKNVTLSELEQLKARIRDIELRTENRS
jgi:hypothetical protein